MHDPQLGQDLSWQLLRLFELVAILVEFGKLVGDAVEEGELRDLLVRGGHDRGNMLVAWRVEEVDALEELWIPVVELEQIIEREGAKAFKVK